MHLEPILASPCATGRSYRELLDAFSYPVK